MGLLENIEFIGENNSILIQYSYVNFSQHVLRYLCVNRWSEMNL